MNDDSSVEIIRLKKRLSQLDERISAQKTFDRKRDSNKKRSLGKVFLLCGFINICDQADFSFREVIIIGGLAKRLGLGLIKTSHFLGACTIMLERCQGDEDFLKECKSQGEAFYQDEAQKLTYPFSLIMGMMIEAKTYLDNTGNQASAHLMGDVTFEDFKQKRRQQRIQQSINIKENHV